MRVPVLLGVFSLMACTTRPAPTLAPEPAPPLPPKPPRSAPFAQQRVLPRGVLFEPTTSHTPQYARQADEALEPALLAAAPVDLRRFFYDLYRSRDLLTLPTHRRVAREGGNPLQRLWSIAWLGELGDRTDLALLTALEDDESPLVREVAANALGRRGSRLEVPFLQHQLAREPDDYVKATLLAAIARLEHPRPLGVTQPVLELEGRPRLRFFLNRGIEGGEHFERLSESLPPTPESDGFVFPHQQYRFGVEGSPPLPNFGGSLLHMGEDSGWFLQGLPVHAMARGVVCRQLFDRSWGSLIVLEHRLSGGERVTSYYGHLHHDLDVAVGEVVERGQKLGEIGPATSVENGGYSPHLHTGLERAPCSEAVVAGYDQDSSRYLDPLWFVLDHPPSD